MKILNRFNSSVIFECKCNTMKECIEQAVKSYANLRDANLSGANFRGAKVFSETLTKNLIYINAGFDYQIW